MDRRESNSDDIRKKRLRRKKFVLAVFGFYKSIINWIKAIVTFKKAIVVFCIWYIINFIEYLKKGYENDFYFPTELAIAIITAFLVELGLTALNSISSKKYKDDEDKGEDYG